MLNRTITVAAITSLAFFSTPSFAVTTFDCKKATQSLTQAICNDKELSRLDDEMAGLYFKHKKIIEDRTTGENKDLQIQELRQEQQDWMTKVLAPCNGSAQPLQCANDAYSLRIEILKEYMEKKAQAKGGSSAPSAQPPQATASGSSKNIKTVTGAISAGGSDANGAITLEKGKRVTFLDDSPIADKIYDNCKIYDVCEVSGEIVNGHLTSITSAKLIRKHQSIVQEAKPAFEVRTFKCEHAAATVLKIICSDKHLATLDVQLSEAYDEHTKIFQNLNVEERNRLSGLLSQDHLKWYRDVLLKCKTAKCAEEVYTQRNDEMYKMADRLEMKIQEARETKTAAQSGKAKKEPESNLLFEYRDPTVPQWVTIRDDGNGCSINRHDYLPIEHGKIDEFEVYNYYDSNKGKYEKIKEYKKECDHKNSCGIMFNCKESNCFGVMYNTGNRPTRKMSSMSLSSIYFGRNGEFLNDFEVALQKCGIEKVRN